MGSGSVGFAAIVTGRSFAGNDLCRVASWGEKLQDDGVALLDLSDAPKG